MDSKNNKDLKVELEVKAEDIFNKTPAEIRDILGNGSIAKMVMPDETVYYLYINGNVEDVWFEIVVFDKNNIEIEFSDCMSEIYTSVEEIKKSFLDFYYQ